MDLSQNCVITHVHTTSSEGMLRAERNHDKLLVRRLSGTSVGFPALQTQGPLLSAFSFSTESKHSAAISEGTFSRPSFSAFQTDSAAALTHGRASKAPQWDSLYLSIYVLDRSQRPSPLSLICCQRLGIQHPPRRNSRRSSTAEEEAGRSWKIFSKPGRHPITPQSVQTCAGYPTRANPQAWDCGAFTL